MSKIKYSLLLASFAILCTCKTFSQKIEIGAGLGLLHYKGDIRPEFMPQYAHAGGHLLFRYNFKKDFSLRATALLGSIAGDDKQINEPLNQLRGKSFQSQIHELNVVAEYNFLNYLFQKQHKDWSPYVFGGIGFLNFSPRDTPSVSYSQNKIVLPLGLGIKYNLKGPWDINVEFGARKTFTDYLDNLGGLDASLPKNLQNDYSKDDMYYYTQVSLVYRFMRIYCPK